MKSVRSELYHVFNESVGASNAKKKDLNNIRSVNKLKNQLDFEMFRMYYIVIKSIDPKFKW